MSRIGLVHLVRASNGLQPFERFLASYRAHPAGHPHDLLMIFKGFAGRDALAPYYGRLDGMAYRSLHVPDRGFDIVPYFRAARQTEHDYLVFLNSFSEIVCDGWLAMMARHASEPGVGLVGATGSWSGLPDNFWPRVKRKIRLWPWYERPARLALAWWRIHYFSRFPNPHVRTNAFLLRRDLLLRLHRPRMFWKGDAYRFESGKGGMTPQVLAMGLRALVVDRGGQAYDPPDWWDSDTFWQANQDRLLIADNQTRDYQCGSYARRRYLARTAWGPRAKEIPFFDAPPTGRTYFRRTLLDRLLDRPRPQRPPACRRP